MEKAEMETTATYDLKDRLVRIFSAIPKDIKKLRKAGFTPVYGNGRDGYGFKVPLDQFTWRLRSPRAERVASHSRANCRPPGPRKGIPEGGSNGPTTI